MRHLFSSLYWFAFLLVMLLLTALLWSIATPQGTHWLITELLQAGGKNIAVSNLSGSLLSHPGIGKLAFQNNRGRIIATGIQLDYRPGSLQQRELIITELQAQQLTIFIKKSKSREPAEPFTIPEFSLPLGLRVQKLSIGELRLERPGKSPLILKNVQLSGAMHQSRLALKNLSFSASDFNLKSSGAFDFSMPQSIQLNTIINTLRGSIANIDIIGPLQDYRLKGSILVKEPHPYIPLRATIDAKGDLEHLIVKALKADLLEGSIIANGRIDWHAGIHIESSFSGRNINPRSIDSRYPGKIGFGGQAKLDNRQLSTQIALLGRLRKFPFQMETDANLNIENQQADIKSGRLLIGPNILRFSGRIDPKSARPVKFSLDAPRLSTFYPALHGTLRGSGEIHGKWLSPEIQLKLTGKHLSFQEIETQNLSLDLSSIAPSGTVRISLDAMGIKRGASMFGSFRLRGQASEQHQAGRLIITRPASKTTAQLNFSGQYDRQRHDWQGSIDNAAFTSYGLPKYRQTIPSALRITKGTLELSKLCLAAGKERICAAANLHAAARSSADLNITHLSIKHFAPWFPSAQLFKETLDASVAFHGDKQRYELSSSVDLAKEKLLVGQLTINPDTQSLQGQINGQFNKLELLGLVSDDLLNPKGTLLSRLTIGGTMKQPVIAGVAELKDASVQLPLAGIKLQGIGIKAISNNGKSAHISGSLTSGKGRLKIDGEIDWSTLKDTHIRLSLSGKDLEAAKLPQAHVFISPDLQIISYQRQTTISGYIRIPKADIQFKRIPEGAVQPSPDTYFIDEPKRKKSSKLNVYSQITIELGKKVHLAGFGLDTGLTGTLRITEIPNKPTWGDGSFKVVDGVYQALGQKLVIERGEIYFNGPLNNPGINLRASKTDGIVTTGLSITGPIQQPESRIFSDPPMDDTNALSYLLTGKPIGSAGGGDSTMLLNAVARLGIKGSAGLINDLRTRTGLDTLAIKPGQDLEQSEVVIGKYLSPRLYLEYTSHLFDDSSILSMQYKLNKHLQLKAESGDETQSIDLIYQIEK